MKAYNRVYHFGRGIAQVMLDGNPGLTFWLLPTVTITFNNRNLIVGLGFEWLFGVVNIGLMSEVFALRERNRLQSIEKLAAKLGVTPKQYALQHSSY